MKSLTVENLEPSTFIFWQPPEGYEIHIGADQETFLLPQLSLPVKIKDLEGEEHPTDNAIGEGVYDYLRQFPDCEDNVAYAELLRDAYSHYLADLAAHAVMLDAKDVEPAYIYRKLNYLKILRLLEPENSGLLWQLAHGFYSLAMTFAELHQVRKYLLQSMRFGQDLVKMKTDDHAALNLLAEVDILFGDYPMAINRLGRAIELMPEGPVKEKVQARLETCTMVGFPEHPLVDDLERIAEAMELYAAGNYELATEILERLEENQYFISELRSADFLCFLGMCRLKMEDRAGAFDALSQALELEPEHAQAKETLASV